MSTKSWIGKSIQVLKFEVNLIKDKNTKRVKKIKVKRLEILHYHFLFCVFSPLNFTLAPFRFVPPSERWLPGCAFQFLSFPAPKSFSCTNGPLGVGGSCSMSSHIRYTWSPRVRFFCCKWNTWYGLLVLEELVVMGSSMYWFPTRSFCFWDVI